ncbi:MAG: large conductance mechanosensitive channel protein MscL [Clostridia bacterium]|nr:large conductance mechanosensitive channel protein MscL [Clostridia bacterium]MBQ3869034.1 large conductance mechanosensitive channel protein MscL [Clostridia bacterium]
MAKSTFFKDFKAFISKGNIIDMAIGVVIGGAFGKIVTGLVNFIINPVISLLTGGVSLENVKTVLVEAVPATETTAEVAEVAILWGSWIQTIIDFLLVALCIFLVLRAIIKAKEAAEKAKKKEEEEAPAPEPEPEPEPEPTEEVLLLREIRDALKKD